MTPVAPGVFRIELPLPWELETVNVYLIRQYDGYLLIDAGYRTDACFRALETGLSAAGVRIEEIRTVVVTHVHPDHVGLAASIQKHSGAEIWMHPLEQQQLRLFGDAEQSTSWRLNALTRAGVPGKLIREMDYVFAGMMENFEWLPEARTAEEGETIPSSVGPIELLRTAGHSPGHLCLYQREQRLLFSGDQMLPRITPNISWMPDEDALGQYLESLEGLGQLDVDLVLPGHGRPFSGHREWIGNTYQHHSERCLQIRGTVPAKTAYEISKEIWRRELHPLHLYFAVMEVMAHLEYMHRRGEMPDLLPLRN